MEKYVSVATYPDEIEARVSQATLAAAEIESFTKYDDGGGMLEFLLFTKGVQLLVAEKDEEDARAILSTQPTEQSET